MKRYSVSLRATVAREVEIEAESPEEAVRLAEQRYATIEDVDPDGGRVGLDPEWVEDDEHGWEIVAKCEACSAHLLDEGECYERPYVYAGDEDGDGVYLCSPCAAKCVEEASGETDPRPEDLSALEQAPDGPELVRAALRAATPMGPKPAATLDVVFDGPPGPYGPRFIEVESPPGTSVRAGEWVDRGDGTWALRLPAPESGGGE